MPFPRKVWIGLLLPRTCKAGYRTGSQVKQRPWKDDMPSFLTQIFQDWGSRVSCVLTRGWDKETQGSLRKTWAWSEQEAVVFVCLLWWEAGPARLHACRQDVTWGGVCSWEAFSGSLWCQLPGKFSLSPLPATDPHGANPWVMSTAVIPKWCPLGMFSLHYVFPLSLWSAKQRSR